MERMQLKAQVRSEYKKGAARRLRSQGFIPAVIYGRTQDPLALAVNHRELDRALHKAGGTNVLFELEIEGKEAVPVMVREYQAHAVDRHLLHVDFLKVDLKQKIHVEVPVHIVGIAPGVKDEGGVLEHSSRQLEVSCLPTAIPEFIEVDVSQMHIGDNIHVKDVTLPVGAEMISSPDLTVVAVLAPQKEKEPAPVEAAAEGEAQEDEKKEEAKEGEKKEEKK